MKKIILILFIPLLTISAAAFAGEPCVNEIHLSKESEIRIKSLRTFTNSPLVIFFADYKKLEQKIIQPIYFYNGTSVKTYEGNSLKGFLETPKGDVYAYSKSTGYDLLVRYDNAKNNFIPIDAFKDKLWAINKIGITN